ncbi:MAG: DUF4157 domain-containing protein [Burkholderiales bacterium]|jgi:hypothetical protein|nr:DUF4157 domain-containing protein [Burkholderiales bacterium]
MKALAPVQTTSSPSSTTGSNFFLQRKCACGGPTGLSGTCEECADKKLLGQPLQAKLVVGSPDDPLEQEADRVADQVLRMPEPSLNAHRYAKEMQLQPLVQRKSVSDPYADTEPPASVHELLRSPGQPLGAAERQYFEPRFGHEFSQVRVYTSALAAASAHAVHSLAYTVGGNIAFAEGRYSPATAEGKRLLAHELTHVVQQGAGNPIGPIADRFMQGPGEVHAKGRNSSRLARAPETSGGTAPALRSDGLTASEINMLNEVRGRLVPVAERSTAIVGILIAEDGRKFELKSGGGQGFSSHVEGKATSKMEELGITKATLLVEKEPCQICDRSVYPQETGPESPLKSSRTGADLSRQTSKINTAMKIGTELTVVDPHSASLYRGVKIVSVTALTGAGGGRTKPGTGTKGGAPTPKPNAGTAPSAAATPKTGAVTPKPATATASNGASIVTSAEARLAARTAAKDLSSNVKILKVARGLNGALRIIGFIGTLLTLDTFTKMTMNSLAGNGFILTKEIAEAESLAKNAASTNNDYLVFSEKLTEMQPYFWRATRDSLASGQAASSISDIDTSLDALRGDLAKQIALVKAARSEAMAKQNVAEKILSDPVASAAIAAATFGTADLAMLFAASQDMARIAGQLGSAAADLTALKTQVDEDFDFIHAWFETLFENCQKGGHCSLTVIDIPFVGTSRIHGLPGEANP